jgi:amidohydrolase
MTKGFETLVVNAANWRKALHRIPELMFDLPQTSRFVEQKLREFGCDEIHTGIAQSGVVAVVRGCRGPGRTIALRSDMDALLIAEETGLPYVSTFPGRMHGCGHDGHMAMLLGAAQLLASSRDFFGTVVLVFQPAEEGGGGAQVMIEEGLLTRFGISEIFGLHNMPGLPVGCFANRAGPLLASSDRFAITIGGKGGHAAFPHLAKDPIVVAAQLVGSLQSIASRRTDPLDAVVLSVTHLCAGNAGALNVIPSSAVVAGTIRTLSPSTREDVAKHLKEAAKAATALDGFDMKFDLWRGYPATINNVEKAAIALDAARSVRGVIDVDAQYPAIMGAEDFAYFLEKTDGAMTWIGNGNSEKLHNPGYDFNDEALRYGIRFWINLVKTRNIKVQ